MRSSTVSATPTCKRPGTAGRHRRKEQRKAAFEAYPCTAGTGQRVLGAVCEEVLRLVVLEVCSVLAADDKAAARWKEAGGFGRGGGREGRFTLTRPLTAASPRRPVWRRRWPGGENGVMAGEDGVMAHRVRVTW